MAMSGKKGESAPVKKSESSFQFLTMELEGTAPLCVCRMGPTEIETMMRKMERGDALNEAEKSKAAKMPRPPRDFEREYRESCYYAPAPDAWPGINVNSLRKACIDACRLTTLKMTLAKMLFFVVPDGFDALTAWPIMRVHGTPEKFISSVRNAGRQRSVDLRARTLFRTWHLKPHIRYDASKITFEEIVQLVQRVGEQVGIGQGRPFSESSAGIGFGLFRVL